MMIEDGKQPRTRGREESAEPEALGQPFDAQLAEIKRLLADFLARA
jgi:hypothetical protein